MVCFFLWIFLVFSCAVLTVIFNIVVVVVVGTGLIIKNLKKQTKKLEILLIITNNYIFYICFPSSPVLAYGECAIIVSVTRVPRGFYTLGAARLYARCQVHRSPRSRRRTCRRLRESRRTWHGTMIIIGIIVMLRIIIFFPLRVETLFVWQIEIYS